ncbi:MAG: ABC transporter ATP-binding protein [Spirochaetes bacterium]|nr:ABC transporter ATP-binding protein [Spirochaetota bacterium]
MTHVLEVNNLSKHFGGLKAVDEVSLKVEKNQIVALIGPNGAGKTTFFNCITGMYKPTSGEIYIPSSAHRDSHITGEGHRTKAIHGLNPHVITECGIARTFQNIRLFQNMTVLENIMIGRHCRLSTGIIGAIFRTRKSRLEESELIHDSHEILTKIGLENYANEFAKNLPYGAQRKLEIARALATDPFLLLLDEPAAGMNPQETKELDGLIVKLRDTEDLSILLIEHDMNLVMSLAENIYVMDYGKLIAQGTPTQIKSDKKVIEAYLGEEIDA